MTLHLIDIASYQAGMDLAVAKRAGFSLVNIKTTQGVTYVHKAGPAWADKARALGMGISTFHWLDNTATGRAQADFAFAQIQAMGGPAGMAHQVDCEDNKKPATQQILRDYITHMQDLLGWHVVVYTGDWWWQSRGWKVADLTPYVWAAPNAGYLPSYPGDTSPSWHAGYGGWGDYALLQYAVGPIAGAGGGDISKSAIRDPQVWAALTGTPTTPITKEDTVEHPYDGWLWAATERARAALAGTDAVYTVPGETAPRTEPNAMARELAALTGKVDGLTGRVATAVEQLGALAANPPGTVTITDEQLERVLRKVVGSVDGASPAS